MYRDAIMYHYKDRYIKREERESKRDGCLSLQYVSDPYECL